MNKILLKTCILSILIASCKLKNTPDHFGVDIRPEVAGPLVDVSLNLKDVVNSQGKIDVLSERSDNVYVITYRDTVFSDTIAKYIKLENQSFSESFQVPAADLTEYNSIPAFSKTVEVNEEVDFAVSNSEQRFEAINFKSGLLSLNFNSDLPYEMAIEINFPDLRKTVGGVALNILLTVPARSKNFTSTVDLKGYKIDLTKNGSTENKLRYRLRYTLKKPAGTGTAITVLNNNFSVKGSLTSLKYSYLAGKLGEIVLNPPASSIKVDLFENFVSSKISFSEPVINLSFDNSAGIDADVVIDPLLLKFAKRNNVETITRNNSASLLDTVIAGPKESNVGGKVTTNVVWNSKNSNIEFAFEPSPFDINYKAQITLNKKITGVAPKSNFITDSSIVRVRAEVVLPTIATLYYLTVGDTVEMTKGNPLENVDANFDSVAFRINTENMFPLDCKVQVYFLDSAKVAKDSIFKNFNRPILPAAAIQNGISSSMTRQYYQRSFSKQDYDKNIKHCRWIYVEGQFNSAKTNGTPQSVKILSSNYLRVKLSGQIKAIIKASTKDN